MVFTFGANGFFGYSASADKETMWWSTCEGEDIPEKTKIDPEDMRAQLKSRHGSWKDPSIQEILDKANVGSIYPTWTTPLLPHWGTDGLILVGDAAHALQPTSGQGSSQAMEDGMTFSLLLKRFLDQCPEAGGNGELLVADACEMASKAYFEIRGPRIASIVGRTKKIANQKKDLSFVQEMTVYFFIWLLNKLPLAISELTSPPHSRQRLIFYRNLAHGLERDVRLECRQGSREILFAQVKTKPSEGFSMGTFCNSVDGETWHIPLRMFRKQFYSFSNLALVF